MRIDAQVHAYERDHPGRPWTNHFHGPAEVTGDDLIRAMDDVGVDGAILVSVYTLYGFDATYAVDVQAAHSGRLAVVKPVDPNTPDVGDTITEWAARDGAVAIRVMLANQAVTDVGIDATFATATACGLAVNVFCPGHLDDVAAIAGRNPDTQVVVDHLGLHQPFEPPVPTSPWTDLPALLRLAEFPNVAIKVTGACTLSKEQFPYPDLWPHLEQVIDRFGVERCLWGTDWTRAVSFLDYRQGVDAFSLTSRLSDSDRAMLMGGSAARIYDWQPTR